jgi:hypothetical protein
MQKDERDLLEVLKLELEFLEAGGYERLPKAAWRPRFIFEDSPTCANHDHKGDPSPCSDCVLMQLVPPQRRSEKIPCRYIPLNVSEETLDSLYRSTDQREVDETVGHWLRLAIEQLEEERRVQRCAQGQQWTPREPMMKGTPLYQSLHPKCANPGCSTVFHWTGGGKFFRFRPEQVSMSTSGPAKDSPNNLHGVRHYWLCERCSHVFALEYGEEYGVVLKLLWPELRVPEADKKSSAA